MSNSIRRADVVAYLKNLDSDDKILMILKEVAPSDVVINEEGVFVWNSGIYSKDLDEEEEEEEEEECNNDSSMELPEWLNKNKPTHVQFYKDMVEAGYEDLIRHYRGRFYYDGPGITVSHHEIHDIHRATKVRLQQDSMGLDYILYPV